MRTVVGTTIITQLNEKSYTTTTNMSNCHFFIFTVFAGAGIEGTATRTCITIPGDVFKKGYYHDCSWVNSQNKEAWVGVMYSSATAVKVKAGGSDLMQANAYSFSIHGFYLKKNDPG